MKRRTVVAGSAAALVLILVALAVGSLRAPSRRRRSFPVAPVRAAAALNLVDLSQLPVSEWTSHLISRQQRQEWKQLGEELADLGKKKPSEYQSFNLGYLHGRVHLENGDEDDAAASFQPYLQQGNPFRDLALFHRAEAAEADGNEDEAERFRALLIRDHPASAYRGQAIDDQLAQLEEAGDLKGLEAFAVSLHSSADTGLRRQLDAAIIIALGANHAEFLSRAIGLLQASAADDAADRIIRALDTPPILSRLTPEQLLLVGDGARIHRHFDRAVAILTVARNGLPAKADEIDFAIGRSYFGNEQFAEAERVYLRGAEATKDPKAKARFWFHASRAAQLQGNDQTGEVYLTKAIAVPGKFPATSSAATQRSRIRLKQKRIAEAAADLQFIKKTFAREHAVVEGALAYAMTMVATGNPASAIRELDSIPRALFDRYDPYEIAYWKGRALESSDPLSSVARYLAVLRADVPTHFAYFARHRLEDPRLKTVVETSIARRKAQVTSLMGVKNFAAARPLQTDIALLMTMSEGPELDRLRSIYEQLPAYAAVLALTPEPAPAFPLPAGADRADQLLALGLFDDASGQVPSKYGLGTMKGALTQSLLLNRGGASKPSIYAIEILMKRVPVDFVPALLPQTVRELLYPRYFHEFILGDAEKYGADPDLVLSIMREESRFNPRAKSMAAARGLLQFIITTAQQVGRDLGLVELSSQDLYDPRVIIQLGTKYIADLLTRFGGNTYQAAAAYNAGPFQVQLWSRMAPADGHDFFFSSINFDETKHYVRKVINSYERYEEIYGGRKAAGGLRAEP